MSCSRTLSPSETALQIVKQVNPYNSNPLGIMHGGHMLEWIVDAATITIMRALRSYALLASIEDTFFISPVRIGDIVTLNAWIEHAGRSSIEAAVLVETEDPKSGRRSISTASHLTLVAVGDDLRPKPTGLCIKPREAFEEELVEEALRRRELRSGRISMRHHMQSNLALPEPIMPEYRLSSYRLVNPEDSLGYGVLHGGRLLRWLDETGGILSSKYASGITVTGAVDATDFYAPIQVGWTVRLEAAVTYVGGSSVEVTIKTIAESPLRSYHAATSRFVYVHIGGDGRPAPVRPHASSPAAEAEALERRQRRQRKISTLKSPETIERLERIKRKIVGGN